MLVRVRLFASLREKLGRAELPCEAPEGATVADVLERLRFEHPALAASVHSTAVNRQYAKAEQVLREGDEIALIPPVSGG